MSQVDRVRVRIEISQLREVKGEVGECHMQGGLSVSHERRVRVRVGCVTYRQG